MAVDEASYRSVVAAIWVLVRTAGSGGSTGAVRAAAQTCAETAARVLGESPHIVIQEHAGAISANGCRVRPDVSSFAATAGLAALMQDTGVTELLVLPEAGVDDFVRMARCWSAAGPDDAIEGLLLASGCHGLHVAQGDEPGPLVVPGPGGGGYYSPSQLGAVFTTQYLTAALAPIGNVSEARARGIVQSVLDKLLRSRRSLAPLSRVRRNPEAHGESIRACVLAVTTAHGLGWDEERAKGAGACALLGPGAAGVGDVEAAELARAARAVTALLIDEDPPEQLVERLALQGELPAAFVDAITAAVSAR